MKVQNKRNRRKKYMEVIINRRKTLGTKKKAVWRWLECCKFYFDTVYNRRKFLGSWNFCQTSGDTQIYHI